jgi:transcriptional regulator with XRE-family HTH domain
MLYLREWRLAKQLTLKQLQARCGIDFRVISKYENDTIDPVLSKLTAIAEALGIEQGDLFQPPPTIHATKETAHV